MGLCLIHICLSCPVRPAWTGASDHWKGLRFPNSPDINIVFSLLLFVRIFWGIKWIVCRKHESCVYQFSSENPAKLISKVRSAAHRVERGFCSLHSRTSEKVWFHKFLSGCWELTSNYWQILDMEVGGSSHGSDYRVIQWCCRRHLPRSQDFLTYIQHRGPKTIVASWHCHPESFCASGKFLRVTLENVLGSLRTVCKISW